MFRLATAILSLILYINSAPVFSQVDPTLLSVETLNRFEKVPEFAFIQKEANKLGVKVYLFGGTASAFAHYVRWDLEREAGDDKYQKERFDYDFTNIYRGNQDLDIVVDGTAEQAQVLRSILKEKFPHFVGSKDAWEVRLLRTQIGDKLPLLDDQDFKNQHTDTNSTGMLALNSNHGDIVFRDLLDWENPNSDFLNDVSSARIKFLFSEKHEKTSRYKTGQNPAILSAIRYIAKLTQYEVKGTEKDLALITKIIREQNLNELSSYGQNKAREFGLKALLNSPNVEFAWNLLEETGLREKLIKLDGHDTSHSESLSWWMNKEPLRSKPLGEGSGETARELGLDIVSHETNIFQAYENITRSSQGQANAFISRVDASGEAAAYGDGFYTQIGMTGARGTGLTIRFRMHPDAVLNTDFTKSGNYIMVNNKNALILIQENLNISVKDYFKMLDSNEITGADKGLLTKLERKFQRFQLQEDEADEIYQLVLRSDLQDIKNNALLNKWFSLSNSTEDKYYSLFQKVYNASKPRDRVWMIENIFNQPHWSKNPKATAILLEMIQKTVRTKNSFEHIARAWLLNPESVNHMDIANEFITPDTHHLILNVFISAPHWKTKLKDDLFFYNFLVKKLTPIKHRIDEIFTEWIQRPLSITDTEVFSKIYKVNAHQDFVDDLFNIPHWSEALQDSDFFYKVIKDVNLTDHSHQSILLRWFSLKDSIKYPDIINKVYRTGLNDWFLKNVFIHSHWVYDTVGKEILTTILAPGKKSLNFSYIIKQDFITNDLNLLMDIAAHSRGVDAISKKILAHSSDIKYRELILKIIDSSYSANHSVLATSIFKNPFWRSQEDIAFAFVEKNLSIPDMVYAYRHAEPNELNIKVVKALLEKKNPKITKALVNEVLRESTWHEHPDIVLQILEQTEFVGHVISNLLDQEDWAKHDEIVLYIINNETPAKIKLLIQSVLTKPFWLNNEKVLDAVIAKGTEFDAQFATYVLQQSNFPSKERLIKKLISEDRALQEIIKYTNFNQNIEFLRSILNKNDVNLTNLILNNISNDKNIWTAEYSDIIQLALNLSSSNKHTHSLTVTLMLKSKKWRTNKNILAIYNSNAAKGYRISEIVFNYRDDAENQKDMYSPNETLFTKMFVRQLILDGYPGVHELLIKEIFLKNSKWRDHEDLIELLIEHTTDNSIEDVVTLLTDENWKDKTHLFEKMIDENEKKLANIINYVRDISYWNEHPQIIDKLISKNSPSLNLTIINRIISNKKILRRVELFKVMLEQAKLDNQIAINLAEAFRQNRSARFGQDDGSTYLLQHPDLMIDLLETGQAKGKIKNVLEREEWEHHPILSNFLRKKKVTYDNLRLELDKRDFHAWYKRYQRKYSCSKIL